MVSTTSKKLNVILDGTITALSDIAVSPPGFSKKVERSTVMTLPRKRYADGQETIYLPATTIRGRLRNLMASGVMEVLNDTTQARFTPWDYLYTASGGIKDRATGGADEREVDLAKIETLRAQNPIVSLFGSMTMKIAGKVMIADAVPSEPVQPNHLGRSVRAHPLQRSPELAAVLDPKALAEFRRLDAARAQGNILEDEAEDLERQVRRLKQAVSPDPDRISTLEAEIKQKKTAAAEARATAGGAVNIQQLLGGYEAIPVQTRLSHSIRLRDVTPTELAFMFLGLQLLAYDPYIGAHRAQGCGKFEAKYAIGLAGKRTASIAAGTLTLEPYRDLIIQSDDAGVQEAFALSRKLLAGINLDGFSFGDASS